MAQRYRNSFEFPRVCRRVVDARFEGGEIASDGGSLLLRQADRHLGFTAGTVFLPLYVFCGDRLLVSYLRRSSIDGAWYSWANLALLVKRLRAAWPKVQIVLRGDSGFCRWKLLRWYDRHGVDSIVGLAKNERLYCARGDMENRIKENQLELFADRTSCRHWWPNQFRLLLALTGLYVDRGGPAHRDERHRTGARLRWHQPCRRLLEPAVTRVAS